MLTSGISESSHDLLECDHHGLRWTFILAFISINTAFCLNGGHWLPGIEASTLKFIASIHPRAVPIVVLAGSLVLVTFGAVATYVSRCIARTNKKWRIPGWISFQFLADLATGACVLLIVIDCVFTVPWALWAYGILSGNAYPD